jgi:hypothetical protein
LLAGVVLLFKDFFVGRSVFESRDVVCHEIVDTVASFIEGKMFDFMLFLALIGRLGVCI